MRADLHPSTSPRTRGAAFASVACAWLSVSLGCATALPVPRPGSLHLAAKGNDRAALEAALAAGARVDEDDGFGKSALWYAAAAGADDALTLLVERGANPNRIGRDGTPPIVAAVRSGRPAAVRALVRGGARLDATGEDGLTPLAIATTRGDRPVFDLLLELGSKPDAPNPGADTPLIRSLRHEDRAFFDRLLAAGADPNRAGQGGYTPLLAALRARRWPQAGALLAAGSKAGAASETGVGALLLAAAADAPADVLDGLLARGANPNQLARGGITPLMVAADAGRAGTVRQLLAAGAPVGSLDGQGRSALLYAAGSAEGDVAVVDELLAAGADARGAAADGLTPLEAACRAGGDDVVIRLHAAGARPAFEDGSARGHELGGTYHVALGNHQFNRGDRAGARESFSEARRHYEALAEIYRGEAGRIWLKEATATLGYLLNALSVVGLGTFATVPERGRASSAAAGRESARQRGDFKAFVVADIDARHLGATSSVEGALRAGRDAVRQGSAVAQESSAPPEVTGRAVDLDHANRSRAWERSKQAERLARILAAAEVCLAEPAGSNDSRCLEARVEAIPR